MEIDKIKTLNALNNIDHLLLRNNCLDDVDCSDCPYENLCELIALLTDKISIL